MVAQAAMQTESGSPARNSVTHRAAGEAGTTIKIIVSAVTTPLHTVTVATGNFAVTTPRINQ